MSEATVHVVTRAVALPGKEEELRSLLLELVEPTRQEVGYIHYELLQSRVVLSEFVLLGDWESQAHFQAHLDSAHVQEVFIESESLLATPSAIYLHQSLA